MDQEPLTSSFFRENPRHSSQVKNDLGDGALSSANGERRQSRNEQRSMACCLRSPVSSRNSIKQTSKAAVGRVQFHGLRK